jgi:hypothetical protein
MAYFSARQRTDGRWDYTCQNGAGVFPIGYCAGPDFAQYDKTGEYAAKYHDDGHATAEEADACHRAHELEQQVSRRESADTQKKCLVCEAWTTKRVLVGQGFAREYALCEEHQDRASLEKVHRA